MIEIPVYYHLTIGGRHAEQLTGSMRALPSRGDEIEIGHRTWWRVEKVRHAGRHARSSTITIVVHRDTLDEHSAVDVGIEYESWMDVDTLAPKPPDEKRAKHDDATRDEFEQWRQIRAEKVADDGA